MCMYVAVNSRMKYMKKIVCSILLFLAVSTHADDWNKSVIVGEWEAYSYQYAPSYERLTINPDFSGCWSVFNSQEQYAEFCFTTKKVKFQDGYAIIAVNDLINFVVSAWGNGEKLLGNKMIYHSNKSGKELINTIPISYTKVGDTNLIEFFSKVGKVFHKKNN